MRIIGFNLSKILIERKEKIESRLEINQNINIKDIISEDIPISKDEVLKITFSFLINYSGDFAKLEFEGDIIIVPEKNELKTFLKSWKDKIIPEDLRAPLFNFIMAKCNIKALSLEDDLSLPYHIQLPRIAPNQDNSNQ